MSSPLAPIVDEVRHLDLVFHDNVVALESYNVIRRDRTETTWRCVSVYQEYDKVYSFRRFIRPFFEVGVSPIRPPRGYSSIHLER